MFGRLACVHGDQLRHKSDVALGSDLFRNLIDRGQGGPPAEKLILPEDMSVVVFKGSRRP